MSDTAELCIHMAIHKKTPGLTCDLHTPIEVSHVEVLDASEHDGIVILKLSAMFHAEDT